MGQILDPKAAFFYGQFVQAAYSMFLDPQGADPLRPEPAGIPDGWELGAWIHMSDFILNIVEPKFYGIVVRENANPDSRIIAIRGTEHAIEWFDDAFAIPVSFRQVPKAGYVACGFDKIYSTLKVIRRKLPGEPSPKAAAQAASETFSGSFADQLEQLAITREVERGAAPRAGEGRRTRPTVVTGHSLGGALTTLFVMENASKKKFDISTLCTFASPRVGTKEFVRLFDSLPINSWRIANQHDLVPKLPPHVPVVLDYVHVDAESLFDSDPFTKKSLVCWHAMESYLHWLDSNSAVRPECKLAQTVD
ncbi:MAG: lipase family protein [Candidatus Sulfotelmatobacter sp.]